MSRACTLPATQHEARLATDHPKLDIEDALDALYRAAVRAHRMDAFDNVDVGRLLGGGRLSIEDARWIGWHLMENGRALAAYRDGQAVLTEAARAG